MDIKLIDRGTYGELLLIGKLDAGNAEQAGELFLKVADRFKDITLNMRELKYVSSAGLRVFKKLYLKLRTNGGELTVSNVPPYILEVFEMTGVAEMLNIK